VSLDFDGVDDVVICNGQTVGTLISAVIYFDADTQGQSNNGALFGHGNYETSVGRGYLAWNATAASKKLRFVACKSASSGRWDMTTGFTTLTGPKAALVTYDSGSNVNDPILYLLEGSTLSVLTVGAGLTEVQTPSGSDGTDNVPWRVGNANGNTRTFDGRLGEHALWQRIFSLAEAGNVLFGGPMKAPGMYLYWPMDDSGVAHATDYSGNARHGILTNGPVRAVNPAVRPAMRQG
jgi:hypothetical protein